ncbi:hypothetical protein APHCRT_0773 [Anaplasma phagocytophilum str. CRT53-1]|uniref:Uncharacterized protein n=1 Tax=Anaplasma phagocytophilum str. CRT53-1 TaxID=1359157 RepID=A0A0F3Q0B0_ANAPH|nr:hypothetical protein APHCRT_0773 [Anaplasma phagocytophilum str. CRT53-1]
MCVLLYERIPTWDVSIKFRYLKAQFVSSSFVKEVARLEGIKGKS